MVEDSKSPKYKQQIKCQSFYLIMIIRGTITGSLSTSHFQPLLSLSAIKWSDTTY